MASTLATFSFALKTRYTDKKVENLTLADRPLLAKLKKDTDFSGDDTVIPLIYGNPQGIASSSLSVAQVNSTNVKGKKFLIDAGDYTGSVSIGDKVIKASRNNPGAFLKNKTAETDGLFSQMSDNIATYAYGNGGNAIGQQSSESSDVITLTKPTDTYNFEVGMKLVWSVADGSAVTDAARVGSAEVIAVDRSAGTVTVDDYTLITTPANGDYLFREGDFVGDTGVQLFSGVGAFIATSNTPADLYGMVRTDDPTRLAGCRVPASELAGLNIEERLQLIGSYMIGRFKGKGATNAYLHPEDFNNLQISLQSRGIRPATDSSTRFGFKAIEFCIGNKDVKVYSDPFCPKDTCFLLRMENWCLHSMDKLIHPLGGDGLEMLRKSTLNDYEFRLVSYPAMSCNAPGYSGRVALD